MFMIEYGCDKVGKTGAARLVERLKYGSTADIMSRIEAKLIELRIMMHIKINLKTPCNIGIERSAKHNAIMCLVILSCRMVGIKVDRYLYPLLDGFKKAAIGEDLIHLLPCFCTYKKKIKNINLHRP